MVDSQAVVAEPAAAAVLLRQEPDDRVAGGIVKSEVRQSHSIFLRMFFENIQPVTRHYGAPWGAY
ncbi:MAG: hypothetical protein GY821_04040 [Gammaproteobacteria bacterium]|nr:hypothetical protein [Gammaproteobacteria bacterium]